MLTTARRASGNVVDYMYARAGVKFAYSVHLRDTGTVRPARRFLTLTHFATPSPSQYGFSLPAEWIRPVGEETANMVRFLAGFIAKQKGACPRPPSSPVRSLIGVLPTVKA